MSGSNSLNCTIGSSWSSCQVFSAAIEVAMSYAQYALIALSGFAAGAVNALAGGGTLICFPVLLATGLPAIAANVTCTIALCPGYLGATLAQRADLHGQRQRIFRLLPLSAVGGLLGAVLLLHTGEQKFTRAVPWLLLGACALLASQERLRVALATRAGSGAEIPASAQPVPLWLLPLVVIGAAYGGFFGAGMSVILLAVLGLALRDTLPRLNALKQTMALATNGAAALWLGIQAAVDWRLIAVLAVSALLGGVWGGRLARRLSPLWLRRVVVLLGIAVAVGYLWRAH
jgi:uncharacterized protein